MLNTKERHQVLRNLQYSYAFNLCPTQVDSDTWTLRPGAGSKRRAWVCYSYYGLFLAHICYKILALVYSLLVLRANIPLHQMLIHAILAAVSLEIAFFYQVLHLKYAHENATFVRMTLTGDLAGGKLRH